MGGRLCLKIFKEEVLKPIVEKKLRIEKGAQDRKEDFVVIN